MNNETEEERMSSLVSSLPELTDEIDGLTDLGITVCFTHEEVGGRHLYIRQRCERIQHLVDSIASYLRAVEFSDLQHLHLLQSELVASAERLLNAFRSLEQFLNLSPDSIRSSVEAFRTGWETMHQVIREIVITLDLLDQAWYSTVIERQKSYRNQLERVSSCFTEASVGPNPP